MEQSQGEIPNEIFTKKTLFLISKFWIKNFESKISNQKFRIKNFGSKIFWIKKMFRLEKRYSSLLKLYYDARMFFMTIFDMKMAIFSGHTTRISNSTTNNSRKWLIIGSYVVV